MTHRRRHACASAPFVDLLRIEKCFDKSRNSEDATGRGSWHDPGYEVGMDSLWHRRLRLGALLILAALAAWPSRRPTEPSEDERSALAVSAQRSE